MIKTIFELPDLNISLVQHGGKNKLFDVIYGKQKSKSLSYARAAEEFGRCVFHALACDNKLDNSGL